MPHEENVFRLQIAMDDPVLPQNSKGGQHGTGKVTTPRKWEALEPVALQLRRPNPELLATVGEHAVTAERGKTHTVRIELAEGARVPAGAQIGRAHV